MTEIGDGMGGGGARGERAVRRQSPTITERNGSVETVICPKKSDWNQRILQNT